MLPAFIQVVPPKSLITRVQKNLRSACPPGTCCYRRSLSPSECHAVRRGIVSMENDNRSSDNDIPQTSERTPLFYLKTWYKNAMSKRKNLKANVLRNYGIAAIISYGFFDALTYSISFLISLQTYLAAGKVLTWKTLPQVLALMWGINNFSRPFRIAGAFALAPVVDRRIVKPFRSLLSRRRAKSSPSED